MKAYRVSASVIVRVTNRIYGANTEKDAERIFLDMLGNMLLDTWKVEMELISTNVSLEEDELNKKTGRKKRGAANIESPRD